MSVARKLIGAAAGLAAAGAVVGVAQRSRVIARRGAGDETPFGSLRSTPLNIITDDDIDLHAEVDEVEAATKRRGSLPDDSSLTVIFAHGYSLNLDCWHFQRAGYRGQIRTVFYDQRSHGRSARSTEDNSTIEQLGSDLLRVIEQASPGPCVLVGHSMGGMSIIALAEQHPELFGDKVVGVGLISTTAGGLDPGRILFPMLPLGLGGRVMGRPCARSTRGHQVVDLARRWGHAAAEVVDRPLRVRRRRAWPLRRLRLRHAQRHPVRGGRRLLSGVRRPSRSSTTSRCWAGCRPPSSAAPRTRSPASATPASCTRGSRARACWSARAPGTWSSSSGTPTSTPSSTT